MTEFRDELRAVALPAAVLIIAGIAALISQNLSSTLGNFGVFGPYTILGIGTAITLWFNRGHAFIALLSLLLAFIAYRGFFNFGADDFPLRRCLLPRRSSSPPIFSSCRCCPSAESYTPQLPVVSLGRSRYR
jgi:hypothetical protein